MSSSLRRHRARMPALRPIPVTVTWSNPMTDRVDQLVAELTLDEKASLTAGDTMWTTAPVPRLGIPSIMVTDGPNGARGAGMFGLTGETAACVPCGSALGASWDPMLLERVGVMLGEEAHTKACRVLLAPTVNMPRSPIGGRNFECYSEDPLLSGRIAAGFVRGVQSQGVVDHGQALRGERRGIRAQPHELDRRSSRVARDHPGAVRARGEGRRRARDHDRIQPVERLALLGARRVARGHPPRRVGVRGVRRHRLVQQRFGRWFRDCRGRPRDAWPGRWFGPALAAAVRDGAVDEALVDDQVRRLLGVLERIGVLDDATPRESTSIDRADHRALAREAATSSMVLLKNDGVLPLDRAAIRTLAVLGPNAEQAQLMGGGSASLAPHYRISPLDALRSRLGADTEIVFERGCDINRATPALGGPRVTTPDGEPGMAVELFANAEFVGEPQDRHVDEGNVVILGDLGGNAEPMSIRVRARFTADETGAHTFTFTQIGGQSRAMVDGDLVFDGVTDPPPPSREMFGMASEERGVVLDLVVGQSVDLIVEFAATDPGIMRGVRIGCRLPEVADRLDRATAIASTADAAIVVVGNSAEWESEGRDRESMDLPGEQDELVRRVAAANPNTVVVVNTGAPVTMDWIDDVGAVVQAWFGGQEMANALVDIVTGDAEPGGRLPITFPLRLEHSPAFGSFPGENGDHRYGEGVLVGYRWYDTRHLPVRFPFGHGLSYTTFSIGTPTAPGGSRAARSS